MNENKSFLVIDTLKNCVDCPLTDSYCMLWRDCDYENVIHKDCLFKQLPALPNKNSKLSNELDFFIDLTNTIYGDNK